MALPIPFRVQSQGSSEDGPRGAIPIALYGASGGGSGGGPVAIDDVTGLSAALADKVEASEFDTYRTQATTAFEDLETQVQTNTQNLENTTGTANSAVQPNDLRLPIALNQAQWDALVASGSVISGQQYVVTG